MSRDTDDRNALRRRLGLLPVSEKVGSMQNVVTGEGPTGVQLKWVPTAKKNPPTSP